MRHPVLTRRRLALAVLASGSALAAGTALAHHGWGSYDAGRIFTISGNVQRLEWANPHVHIDLAHQGRTWEIVLAPPFRMSNRGLSEELIKAGAQVSVEGYPSTRVETEMRAERIVVNGKTFELR